MIVLLYLAVLGMIIVGFFINPLVTVLGIAIIFLSNKYDI